jgi:hypothetical protein
MVSRALLLCSLSRRMAARRSRCCDARDSGRVLTARADCSARRIKIGSGIRLSRWCKDGGRGGTNGASDSRVDRCPALRNNWVQPRTGPGFRRWCRRLHHRQPTRQDPLCVHPKRFSTPSLTLKILCTGNLNPRTEISILHLRQRICRCNAHIADGPPINIVRRFQDCMSAL